MGGGQDGSSVRGRRGPGRPGRGLPSRPGRPMRVNTRIQVRPRGDGDGVAASNQTLGGAGVSMFDGGALQSWKGSRESDSDECVLVNDGYHLTAIRVIYKEYWLDDSGLT